MLKVTQIYRNMIKIHINSYITSDKMFMFKWTTDGNHTFYMKEYTPIRIKISMLEEMKISLNRVPFNVQTMEIDNQNNN